MGLDAYVPCNCYRLGLTTPPPVPVALDEETGQPELVAEGDGKAARAAWRAFEAWRERACAHPRFDEVSERIGNWAGVRRFQEALRALGTEHFRVLLGEIPDNNGGATPPPAARDALDEIARFRSRVSRLPQVAVLVDEDADRELHTYIAVYGGEFLFSGAWRVGVDPDGLFVRDADHEVFRARRVDQTVDQWRDGRPRWTTLTNRDTGATWAGPTPVPGVTIPWPDGRLEDDAGRVRSSYPARLAVVARPQRPDDYAYILAALERVFRASVETGNPVHWT